MSRESFSFVINRIEVNAVFNNSGIFVGSNRANDWHTQQKTNNGFGSAGNGVFVGNTNILFDNDVVDAPMKNREWVISQKKLEDPYPKENQNETHPESTLTLIKFNAINVNALNRNSTVAIGENDQLTWKSHQKNNYGNGVLSGNNQIAKNLNIIQDEDLIDAPISEHQYISTIKNTREEESDTVEVETNESTTK